MNRSAHYEELKELARKKREHYCVDTKKFGLREVRKIYKSEGVHIDQWTFNPRIKAVYMCDDDHYSVAIQKKLPDEPKIFALLHELKHHYRDQEAITSGQIMCGDWNQNEVIEIGAEVFAAEFIYPETEFMADINQMKVARWRAEDVVHLKRNCNVKVSYTFLQKRLTRLGLITQNQFKGTRFRKLEDQLYGVPYHRRRIGF